MDRSVLDIPTRIETKRLYLRPYQPGDGGWYYAVGQRNHAHLQRYESGNPILGLNSEAEAEALVQDFATAWAGRDAFFLGAFGRQTGEFVAQIYIGVVGWEAGEFEVGYFADTDHEGQGYVAEAVRATLAFLFEHLRAQRVRLECDDTNTRSARVAQRCGMVCEGHSRGNKQHPDGSCSGTLYFRLLRHDFEAFTLSNPRSIFR